ncbi:hypothetical protein [Nesterenkonia populi]|uniref:hypothetical protein n=1 Tax=Nesterenkonia populi TaxID=1591087 RepID=UPI0011BE5BD5|nr:hypothetical protein [Nesterenkonia populi]
MKYLSRPQRTLMGGLGFALLATLITIVLEAWQFAALGAVVSFGIFAALVVFTLAALTRSMQLIRTRVRNIDPRVREIAAGVRRLDNRTAERFKTLEATQARLEASERRVLASVEAHRFDLEDEISQLHTHLQDNR